MMKVENILQIAQQQLLLIQDNAPLVDAARLLNDRHHTLVVVCDEIGKMAGVITKTDIVSRISHCTGCNCIEAAANVMTRDAVSCHPDDWLHDVWSALRENNLKNIPVVNQDSKPVGVLNAKDVFQVLLEDVQHEEELLRDYVMGVGYR